MLWVAIALVSLAVAIVFVLSVPLDMVFRMDMDGQPKSSGKLVWLFGLYGKELGRKKKITEKEKKMAEGQPGRRGVGVRAGTVWQVLKTKGLLKELFRLLKSVLGCLKIRELGADLSLGFGDPADTALVFAVLGPVFPFLGSSWRQRIRVEPSFEDRAVFEGYLHGAVRLRPIHLVPPLTRFVFSRPVVRVLKILVRGRWLGKR